MGFTTRHAARLSNRNAEPEGRNWLCEGFELALKKKPTTRARMIAELGRSRGTPTRGMGPSTPIRTLNLPLGTYLPQCVSAIDDENRPCHEG
jgi:hypothetical protein